MISYIIYKYIYIYIYIYIYDHDIMSIYGTLKGG